MSVNLNNNKSNNRIELTPFGESINGAMAIAGGLIPTQPLFALKTYMMAGLGYPPIRRLWAGYPANAGSGAPAEAVTFAVYELGLRSLNTKRELLNNSQNFTLSFLGGVLGSPFNSSLERCMILKEIHGGRYSDHVKKIYSVEGIKGFFKGTVPTALRDGSFAIGIFALNDFMAVHITPSVVKGTKILISKADKCPYFLNKKIKTYHEEINYQIYSRFTSGLLSGMVIGAITTPFDLSKTLIQEDLGKKHPNFRVVMRELWNKKILDNKGNALSFFSGWKSRSITIGALICATTVLKEYIPSWLPINLRQLEAV